MKILDVGCGAGHYLRSLRNRLDPDIEYVGVDATRSYIDLAKKANPGVSFFVGDVEALDFSDGFFESVLCNNVICHLPPSPKTAISELLRVASRYVVIRTLFGVANYEIKQMESDGYIYHNIYTDEYMNRLVHELTPNSLVKIVLDQSYENFCNEEFDPKTGTKTVGTKQICGNIVYDWRFMIIDKGANTSAP